jgi:hypothetical protein
MLGCSVASVVWLNVIECTERPTSVALILNNICSSSLIQKAVFTIVKVLQRLTTQQKISDQPWYERDAGAEVSALPIARVEVVLVSFYFALLGKSPFFPRQKKRRPASTFPRVRCDVRQKPADLKLAAFKHSGPLNGFCLNFSLASERDRNGEGIRTPGL